ncbi:hypothetical protein N7468_004430 [Penicillium chermesinum]|uniref:Impact N-terminal domain-containing protein n=1 Tax=Penicillium chermesinum TaxID=63820 RepID=A0A9W9TSK6_9EURO|nr:uncharacterized protein N7468_004430 [Penicillium chermesinum]KAJ5239811.1 hypothetical protein N7468_004430 [Penicillium chermesinum]
MSSAQVPALLRFLSQDAKVSLAVAMAKVPELQKANLASSDKISKSDLNTLEGIFSDTKVAKQVLNAAKRVAKKRGAPSDNSTPTKKKRAQIGPESTPFEIETSLRFPSSSINDDELRKVIIVTNRAPLVLAFALSVLKYTRPEQPISSRLSLAQALVSANSRTKAVSLGIERGEPAEQERLPEGHPAIKVLGREIPVLKRWDYDPREGQPDDSLDEQAEPAEVASEFLGTKASGDESDRMPPLWGLDPEALQNSNLNTAAETDKKPTKALPIHTPQAARSYIIRSISLLKNDGPETKPKLTSAVDDDKEMCVSYLLHAIDSLDKRAWFWYLKVRPDVQTGVQGWGEKGQVKLAHIINLRKTPDASASS